MPLTRSPAFIITAVILLLAIFLLAIQSDTLTGILFVFCFSLGPLFISLVLSMASPGKISQIILTSSSLLYALWYGFVYLDAFHFNSDAQSALNIIFVGIYSLPAMIPVWIFALAFRCNRIP